MKRISPLFLSIIVFLFYQLMVFNLFSGLLDEGFILYNSHLISQGQIPYRDFFMTTTPGSFYVLALFFKLFGNYIVIGRVLGIISVIITLFFCNKIFQLKNYWQYLYLFSLSILLVSPAKFFMYNDAIYISIIALYFMIEGINKNKLFLLFISGLLSALCFLFKQSVGGLLIPAYAIGIFLVSGKTSLRKVITYIFGVLALFIPVTLYFSVNHALSQAVYYVFFFASAVKNHQSSFVIHRLIAIPVLVIAVYVFKSIKAMRIKLYLSILLIFMAISYLFLDPQRIGRLMTYLLDPIFYWQTLTFLFLLFTFTVFFKKSRINENYRKLTLVAISAMVIFLSIAASGYNTGPVTSISPLIIPLFIQMSQIGTKIVKNKRAINAGRIIIIIFFVLSFSYNPLGTFGPSLIKDYNTYIPIKEAKFIRFTPQQATDLTKIIAYIKTNTKEQEKIFCFPYCPGLYFFSERMGASYYNLFYGETFIEKDQTSVITDLQKNDLRIAIIQKTGVFDQRKQLEEQRLSKIRNYILKNFSPALNTPNFTVLKRLTD
jgi:hypothetical protein